MEFKKENENNAAPNPSNENIFDLGTHLLLNY